jgi:hypothetical protein
VRISLGMESFLFLGKVDVVTRTLIFFIALYKVKDIPFVKLKVRFDAYSTFFTLTASSFVKFLLNDLLIHFPFGRKAKPPEFPP